MIDTKIQGFLSGEASSGYMLEVKNAQEGVVFTIQIPIQVNGTIFLQMNIIVFERRWLKNGFRQK